MQPSEDEIKQLIIDVLQLEDITPADIDSDAPLFGDVITGISLSGASRMRFRPYVSPKEQRGLPPRRATHEVELEPRSAYLISGDARRDFEHSIPAVDSLRYSITFRTLRP